MQVAMPVILTGDNLKLQTEHMHDVTFFAVLPGSADRASAEELVHHIYARAARWATVELTVVDVNLAE